MDGFRDEMNLTLVAGKNGNDSAKCAGGDEKENTILVSTISFDTRCSMYFSLGYDSSFVFCWLFRWSTRCRRYVCLFLSS